MRKKAKKKPMKLHHVKNRSQFVNEWRDFRYGKPPKLIGNSAETGLISEPSTKAKVTKRIKEIIGIALEFKIGVMGDTAVRMDGEEYRKKFEFVTRVYKTTSKETAKNYEVELIKKFKKIYPNKILNTSEAKASRLTTYNGDFYIYVVYNKSK